MYKVGDKVMHQREGACNIRDIVHMNMMNENREYYLLEPILNISSAVYISTDANRQKNIRPIIEENELILARKEMKQNPLSWIEDPKTRLREIDKRISAFEFNELLLVFECLKTQDRKKKLSNKDQEILGLVEKILFSEIALLYDVAYEDINNNQEEYCGC